MCGIRGVARSAAPLQLDHVNGDRRDNRLENLRILCRNCHAQTETWCSRNRGRYSDTVQCVNTPP
ncbi:MAG: HNH endonuclease [Actinomycetota bacterium]|nr:HNH endonuclease [Actinomycetota bacterium]